MVHDYLSHREALEAAGLSGVALWTKGGAGEITALCRAGPASASPFREPRYPASRIDPGRLDE